MHEIDIRRRRRRLTAGFRWISAIRRSTPMAKPQAGVDLPQLFDQAIVTATGTDRTLGTELVGHPFETVRL